MTKITHEQFIAHYQAGRTDPQIARLFGCTSQHIGMMRRRANLLPNINSMSLEGQNGVIAQAVAMGKHDRALALRLALREPRA